MLTFLLITFCLASPLYSQTGKKCRALVLEGGGDMGAYQAGVLSEMVKLIPSEVQYDVISGVSVGALNAAGLSQFAPGDEVNATNFLLNVWRTITAGDVYQDWPGGIIDGVLFRSGIYDTSPLKSFLETHFTAPMQRKLNVGACDANNGSFVRFDETLNKEDLISAVRASSAFPVVFPYVEFQGTTYIDGGTVLNLDVTGAILRCREIVDSDADIVIDTVLCTGAYLPVVDPSNDKTIQMLSRFLQIYSYSNALDDWLHAKEDNPGIFFRYIIMPSSPLPSGEIPLGFKPEQIEEMINVGIKDAIKNVGNGTNYANWTQIENDWKKHKNERGERKTKNPKKFLNLAQ